MNDLSRICWSYVNSNVGFKISIQITTEHHLKTYAVVIAATSHKSIANLFKEFFMIFVTGDIFDFENGVSTIDILQREDFLHIFVPIEKYRCRA